MRLLDLENARTVGEALDIANRAGVPVQNFVVADEAGQIGWTVMGQIPVRANYDPNFPASWRASQTGWIGWRAPQEYPRIVDSPSGHLWLANARPIDAVTWLNFIGNGSYDTGARAGQIRDDLRAIPSATVADMVKVQLDDRALFLTRWRDLLLEILERTPSSKDTQRAQVHELVKNWSARADANDVGYAIVRAFRLQVRRDVFDTLTASARAKYPDADFEPSPQFEGSLWQIVTQRPMHLLNSRFQSWDEALLSSLDAAIGSLHENCDDLNSCTWGRQNTLQMRHPLSAALPWLAQWLDMPEQAMSGDAAMPRVQGPKFGASERLVVSPGRESEGVLQMPGGPVDHPLSPFYGAGHEAWVRGDLVPLLPGKTQHVLRLTP
jgi:penicillin amidase